ncbi:zinc-dependent alcohol dehydrogenase [Thermoactinospora rubra]|uniref:zinc-dependent alcohol dehydrogenase n=1 Tax=Thermoactinospora rubra TaxID=1088767 RepID=UPI000A11487D|nr:alcohol dehydrogenase catalytic domain-containing protein [Thermoactinospora rubra]
MKALRKLAKEHEHFELADVEEPEPAAGWVVLRVLYAGICGTDLHIMHNAFPSWPPVTVGHEFLGRVAAVGDGVGEWAVGDRVVCEPHALACGVCHLCRRGHAEICARKRSPGWGIDGGMAELVHVPAHLLHRVPDSVPDLAAALCEPAAIVLSGLERMPVHPGSVVLVFGPGPIGLLSAMAARACGAGRVVLVGRPSSRSRLDLARRLGLETWDSTTADVAERAHEITGGRGADLVIESSGSPDALAAAIGALRRRGRLLVLGVSDSPQIRVPWATAMNRALDVTFSLSSSWSSWDAALALMARGALDPAPLATVFPLGDWQDAFTALAERHVVKALLDPRRP